MILEEFFKKEYVVLVKRIKARNMQECDAEDVVQEAFYRAVKYIKTYNPERQKIGAWFSTILNNAFKDYRHVNYTGEYKFREEDEELVGDLEEETFNKQIARELKKEIATRPEVERNILYAAFELGFSYKACSQVFDVSFTKVQFILQEFRKEMRSKYE